jgi:hypothetical protein
MESLYDLAKLCVKQKQLVELLIPEDEKSPLRRLFKIAFSEKQSTEVDCMIEIYGKRNQAAFARLKGRLRDVLFQAIILQSQVANTEDIRSNEFLYNFRQTLISRILLQRRAVQLSTEIIEKSIVKSMRYHVTENVLEQSRMLIAHYNGAMYNKYKLNKYQSIQSEYLEIYKWEIKSENYYLDLQRDQFQSLANPSDEMKNKAYTYFTDLQKAKGIRSYFFNYNKYRIEASYFEYTKNYIRLLEISENALKEFNAPDFKTGNAISAISLRKLWALIQVEKLEESIKVGSKLMSRLPSGSVQWYRIAHYTLKAKLYFGDYAGAIATITEMIENPKFAKLGDYFKEIFTTTLGYIHLLIDSGMISDVEAIKYKVPEFKLGKFLNTTPTFSKDKRGINVSILLMHIGFLLQRKDYNAIIDRVDSLNQYAYRYLRKDDSFRSNCMIKMVIQMAKADFNPIRTARYTADLQEELSRVALAGSGENIEIEIIPFEVLWNVMNRAL